MERGWRLHLAYPVLGLASTLNIDTWLCLACSTGEREGEDEGAEGGSDQQRYAYIDELGKKTLESDEACSNVIEQLRARLEEVCMLMYFYFLSMSTPLDLINGILYAKSSV